MNPEQNSEAIISSASPYVHILPSTAVPKVRTYFSTSHLWAAKHFIELAIAIEKTYTENPSSHLEYRAYITNSIFSSIAFLEAAINEFIKDIVDGEGEYIELIDNSSKNKIREMWESEKNIGTLEKYEMILIFCRNNSSDKGSQLFQDVDLAIQIRNELMHYKPNSYGGCKVVSQKIEGQHKLARKLRNKFLDNPLITTGSCNPYFPDKCLGSPCAAWVVKSVENLTDDFFRKLEIVPNYQQQKLL